MQERIRNEGKEGEEEREKNEYIYKRVFIINFNHVFAVILIRLLGYVVKKSEIVTTSIRIKKWRILVTIAILESKHER